MKLPFVGTLASWFHKPKTPTIRYPVPPRSEVYDYHTLANWFPKELPKPSAKGLAFAEFYAMHGQFPANTGLQSHAVQYRDDVIVAFQILNREFKYANRPGFVLKPLLAFMWDEWLQ